MTTAATKQLDELLSRLDEVLSRHTDRNVGATNGDAIDQVLASPPRMTATQSLREHPAVLAFREEMLTGVIQIDTLHQFLGLLRFVLGAI